MYPHFDYGTRQVSKRSFDGAALTDQRIDFHQQTGGTASIEDSPFLFPFLYDLKPDLRPVISDSFVTDFEFINTSEETASIAAQYPITETQMSVASDTEINDLLSRLEKKYEMTSEEFSKLWDLGRAPDTFETNLWAILISRD